MPTFNKLAKLLQVIVESGKGEELMGGADHDIIYLLPPEDGDLEPEEIEATDFGAKMVKLGAHYDESNGWCIHV